MRYIAFDFETELIEAWAQAPRPVCMSYTDGNTTDLVRAEEAEELLWNWLWDPGVTVIGANVAFDLSVAWVWSTDPDRMGRSILDAYASGRVVDVQIRDRLAHLRRGRLSFDPTTNKPPSFSLAALVHRHLGRTLDKGDSTFRLGYGALLGLPISAYPDEAIEYAVGDAVATWDVWQALGGADGAEIDEDNQTRAAWALRCISLAGLEVDTDAARALEVELAARVAAVDEQLRQIGVLRPDGSRNMARLRVEVADAYRKLGKAPPQTEGGQVATSGEALLGSGHPVLVAAGEAAGDSKLLSGFLPSLQASHINPNYDLLKETGRTSSWGPNIQQMPRSGGVRELFRPLPGCVFLDADYSTLELCALAQVCLRLFGDSAMARAINRGQDLHLLLASQLLGIPYREAVTRHKAGDEDVAAKRQIAKAANFGFPGGMGAASFVEFARGYGLDLSLSFVEALRADWLRTYPEMSAYFEHINSLAQGKDNFDLVQVGSGRKRGGCRYTSACNSLFQGLAADGAKQAAWELVRQTTLPWGTLRGCVVHAFVHDEFLLSAPREQVATAGAALERIMVDSMRAWIPDVRISVDVVAAERWTKRAKRVVNAQGLLEVWCG